MKTQVLKIQGIPAILWGEDSDRVYVHVHGKMSRKEYAESFAVTAARYGFQTLSFDLPEHGERSGDHAYRCDIWNGMHDLSVIADYAFPKWKKVNLFACSLGAYFSLNAYADRPFGQCLFQSPILDMEYMIRQMLQWNGVTEERLKAEGEIPTPTDPLRWDYFQYVLSHPIHRWDIPTSILYGGKDNFQHAGIVRDFAERHHAGLTVSKNSEHPFMAPGDDKIFTDWLAENIRI